MNLYFQYQADNETKTLFIADSDSNKKKNKPFMFRNDNVVRPRKNSIAWTGPTGPKYKGTMGFNNGYYNYDQNGIPIVSTAVESRIHNTKYDTSKSKKSNNRFRCITVIWKHIQEFCSGTSLHGLRYVGEEDVSVGERIFWVVSFMLAVSFATYFISNIYERWDSSPVIISINPKFTSITAIPFPAITICNMNQARKRVAKKIVDGNDEIEKMLLYDFCNVNDSIARSNITDDSLSSWDYVKKFMLKVGQPCSEMIEWCRWSSTEVDCRDIIHSALTDEGICCTFNRVHSKYMYYNPYVLEDFKNNFLPNAVDWTPENGYPANSTNNSWPYRPLGAGAHLGLTLVINLDSDDYYCSSTNSIGLKIRLHSPVEAPKMADFGFFLHPRKEVRLIMKPTIDEASPTLESIPIEKRQCLFANERKLTFYRTYTTQNCELECESNYTLQICNCVPFYLPKNISTKICGKKKEQCYRKAKDDIETSGYVRSFCKCLPGCYEITYAQDHSLGDIANPDLIKADYNRTNKVTNLIILHFYFAHSQIRSYQKSELFGFTEFLSNTGGLLGLFLGFSFLSAVEIGYHLTIRIWCVYRRKKKQLEKNVILYPFAK